SFSDPVAVVAPLAVADDSKPEISVEGDADPQVGETLIATDAKFNDDTFAEVSGQWYRDGDKIDGATGDTYTLSGDDIGSTITYQSTATRGEGEDLESVTSDKSNEIGPVDAAPEILTSTTIKGDPKYVVVGETLTGLPAEYSDGYLGKPNTNWYWYSDAKAGEQDDGSIEDGEAVGVQDPEYEATENYAGYWLRFRAKAFYLTPSGPVGVASFSDPVAVVAPLAVADDSKPEISVEGDADPQVGETLIATDAKFNDDTFAEVSGQWYRDGDKIDGATDDTYKLSGDDIGSTFTYQSTATRGEGEDLESVTSDKSNEIGPVDAAPEILTPTTIKDDPKYVVVGETLTGLPAEYSDGYLGKPNTNWYWYSDAKAGEQDDGSIEDGEAVGVQDPEYEATESYVGYWLRYRTMAAYNLSSGIVQLYSYSDPVAVVAPLAVEDGSKPEITIKDGDKLQAGSTLKATDATFNDDEFASVAGQWYSDGGKIPGATGNTYTLTGDDVGSTITYKSTATRGDEEVSSESDPTDKVAKAPLKVDKDASISGTPEVGKT